MQQGAQKEATRNIQQWYCVRFYWALHCYVQSAREQVFRRSSQTQCVIKSLIMLL